VKPAVQRLSLGLAALWWGGLSAVSFVVVPTLFAQLGAPVAGPVAANLFSLQARAGLLIGLALLLLLRSARGSELPSVVHSAADAERMAAMQRVVGTMGLVLAAMILALLQEFGVAQNIITARASGGNLRLWHGVGSAMVLGQWLCAGAVLWRLSR
jgi:hypothetical protein